MDILLSIIGSAVLAVLLAAQSWSTSNKIRNLREEVAAEALRDMIPVKDPRRITPDLIMAIVAEYFSVSVKYSHNSLEFIVLT